MRSIPQARWFSAVRRHQCVRKKQGNSREALGRVEPVHASHVERVVERFVRLLLVHLPPDHHPAVPNLP